MPEPARSRQNLIAISLITILAIAAYWNTLPNDFVAGDLQFVRNNPHVGSFDAVRKSFVSDYWKSLGGEAFLYYRPLVVLTHFFDVKLYGLQPGGHHFSNMLYHVIATLLVYQLLLRLLAFRVGPAALGSILFAVHPIHTHSVSYVVGRTDILATIFYLAALLLLIDGLRDDRDRMPWGKTIAAGCLFFLALLCKEMAVTLPAVLVCLSVCTAGGYPRLKNPRLWIMCAILGGILISYALLRFQAVGFSNAEEIVWAKYSLSQRISLVFVTLGFYVNKLLLPLRLCYFADFTVPGSWREVVTSGLFWTGIAFSLVLLAGLARPSLLSLAVLWIGITLLPVLNIVRIAALAKENFLYLPSVGFCLLFAAAAAYWSNALRARVTVYALLSLVSAAYLIMTLERNREYKNPVIFLEETLRDMTQVPEAQRKELRFFDQVKNFYVVYFNLGNLYHQRGEWDKAASALTSALGYMPAYFPAERRARALLTLGIVEEKRGNLDAANTALLQAWEASPRRSDVDVMLGLVAVRQGRMDEAGTYFKRAISENPANVRAHFNLGLVYRDTGKLEEFRAEMQEASRLDSEARGMPDVDNEQVQPLP